MTRVLITGSRTWTDKVTIYAMLNMIQGMYPGPYQLIHGDAAGADKLAATVATELGWTLRPFPVTPREWREYGRAAGPKRNQRMIDEGVPQVAVVFRQNMSAGSSDCKRRSEQYKKTLSADDASYLHIYSVDV